MAPASYSEEQCGRAVEAYPEVTHHLPAGLFGGDDSAAGDRCPKLDQSAVQLEISVNIHELAGRRLHHPSMSPARGYQRGVGRNLVGSVAAIAVSHKGCNRVHRGVYRPQGELSRVKADVWICRPGSGRGRGSMQSAGRWVVSEGSVSATAAKRGASPPRSSPTSSCKRKERAHQKLPLTSEHVTASRNRPAEAEGNTRSSRP